MEFLSHHGIQFTAKDIWRDPGAMEELLLLPSRTTPTTLVDRQIVIGFDRRRLSELLGI